MQLNFSTTQARENFESKNVPFLPGGIHENITIKDIVIDKLPAGNKYYIRFVYESSNGLMMQHTEFEPNKRPFQSDEDFQKSIYNQINRIINNQITPYYGWDDGKYIPDLYDTRIEEERIKMEEHLKTVNPQYDGTSFFGFINWLKEQIEDVSKVKKLRIKVVYGDKGYTTLPRYSQYVSVEPMEATKRQITELSIDKFKPLPVDDEKKVDIKNDPLKESVIGESNTGYATNVAVGSGIDPLSSNVAGSPFYPN